MSYTEKQLMAIELLAQGESITNISTELGVSRKTIYNWQKKEGFQEAVKDKASENIIHLGKRVISALNKNLGQIEAILGSDRSQRGEKIRAFSMLLANVKHLSELGDLNQRLLSLEKRLKSSGL